MRHPNLLMIALVATSLGIGTAITIRFQGENDPGKTTQPTRTARISANQNRSQENQRTAVPRISKTPTDSASASAQQPNHSPPSREASRDLRVENAPLGAEPSFDFVRSAIASALEAESELPEVSSADIDRLAEAALKLRLAQMELRTLSKTQADVVHRHAAQKRIESAILDFTEVLGLTPAEFSSRVQGENAPGISTQSAEDRPVVIRTIESSREE